MQDESAPVPRKKEDYAAVLEVLERSTGFRFNAMLPSSIELYKTRIDGSGHIVGAEFRTVGYDFIQEALDFPLEDIPLWLFSEDLKNRSKMDLLIARLEGKL